MKNFINRVLLFIISILMVGILSCKKEDTGYIHNPSSSIIINDFLPKQGGGGTEILINGENFSSDTSAISISINEIPLKIIGANGNQIMAVVPKKIGSGPLKIVIGDNTTVSDVDYSYLYTRTVTTLAGNGTAGFANGKGTDAMFNFNGESWYRTSGIAVDDELNVYVTDVGNHCIRKIDQDGNVTTLAGSPSSGGYVDGKGSEARFSIPYGLTIDNDGNLYSVDPGNWDIRKITSEGVATTLTSTVTEPWAITFDRKTGNLYYTSCTSPASVYQVKMDGTITPILSGLNYPLGLAFDNGGNLFVTVHGDNQIEKFEAPNWTGSVVAGTGNVGWVDGVATVAEFAYPWGMAIDNNNNLYIAGNGTGGGSTSNPDQSVRLIDANTFAVSTFAGSRTAGYVNAVGLAASFSAPAGVAVDRNGTVYVLDRNNNSVRKIVSE